MCGTLPSLGEAHRFCDSHCVRAAEQVSLPATNLSGIFVSSPLAEVTVGPGFSADQFLVAAPFSGGDISVLGIDTPDLTLMSSG